MKYILTLICLLLTVPAFAGDKVRVQVITDGDAFYYPKDKYCTPEQAERVLAIVGTDMTSVNVDKVAREAQRQKDMEEASKIVPKEPTKEELLRQASDLQSERQAIEDRIAETQAKVAVLEAKPIQEEVEK